MLVNKRLSAPDYRTQTLASMMAKSLSFWAASLNVDLMLSVNIRGTFQR